MSGPINYSNAKGEDVRRVVEKIEDSLSSMCDACRGSGQVSSNDPDVYLASQDCQECDGTGKVSEEDEIVVLMACLSLALMIQMPSVNSRELHQGVLGASEWISLFLASIEDGDMDTSTVLPKNKVN